jgi:trigger factor
MAETAQHTVDIEEAGPCLRKINITVPGDAVTEHINGSLAVIADQAALPGFRPGCVPRRLLEKKFGTDIRNEARQRMISEAYQQAVQEHDLEVLGEPEIDGFEDIVVEPGTDVSVTLEVEVAPAFDLPELDGLEIKKPLIEATDERIDANIERMALNEGELEPQDTPERGDYLIGHGIMREKGAAEDAPPLLDLPGAVVRIPQEKDEGKGMILGIVVDNFGEQIGLPKAGETVTVTCTGPENHEKEEVRGKDVEITYEVDQVQRIIPASVEQLCERYGMSEEAQLRAAIKQRLEQRIAVEQQSAMRQQVARHLLESVDFELPEKISARQAARNLQRRALELQQRGVDQTVIEERLAELRSASAESARRELKLFFILARVAKALEVQVTEQEVLGNIAQMAMSRGERPEALRDQLIKNGQVNMLAQQIRENKALDAILVKASVEELSVDDFNKAMRGTEGVEEIDATSDE